MTSTRCMICLGDHPDSLCGDYHRDCLLRLWDVDTAPGVDFDPASLPALIAQERDNSSISGFQPKALVRRDQHNNLEVPPTGATHILKPPSDRHAHMPENEHLTMSILARIGLDTPPCGLLKLRDGSLAYVVRRFDRAPGEPPRKLHKLDFCQFLDRPPEHMYEGSGEACARAIRERADSFADPAGTLRDLFRLFLAAYWLGHGDLHLKNISLLEDPDDPRLYRLAPAYDFQCTWFYGRDNQGLALGLGGRKSDLHRRHFVDAGTGAFDLPANQIEALIDAMLSHEDAAAELITRSLLPFAMQQTYRRVLVKRTRALRL